MKESKATLTWPTSEPHIFARKLREAMAAAQHYPEFEPFHDVRDFYRIRPRRGWVEAEWIGPVTGAGTAHKPSHFQVEEALDAQSVVGACIKFEGKANELHFPNAVLSEHDKGVVFTWGMGEVPQWRLIVHDKEGITMTRKKGVDPLFFWQPQEVKRVD
jgi:hypothetical protein